MRQRYLRLLERWAKASEQFLYTPHDRTDLSCYGSGYDTWGVQTNQKALSAYCVLAVDPDLDTREAGISRDEITARALRLLRFSLESHVEGSYHCTDGVSWGHSWISVLGVERMMHGVDGLTGKMTVGDNELLRKVLISEADWLHDSHEIVAGLYGDEGRNKPESNIWNGGLLHRVAAMYPDSPRTAQYREKGDRFLANGISVPADSDVEDANFFDTYALNHHSYLNVGYMVVCLSNLAMTHFFFKARGMPPPDVLYKHAVDLWNLVKEWVFPDGRLLRIGGDTRARYCYCQDYLIPTLLFIADIGGDGIDEFESGWLGIVESETRHNGDGLFLSDRCATLREVSPLYFTRLESDRASCLSMGAYWRRLFPFAFKSPKAASKSNLSSTNRFSWHDSYHGSCFYRGGRRIASWTWRSAEPPQGLVVPAGRSDMAEWRYNLSGEVQGTGNYHEREVMSHDEWTFDGGFLTCGTFATHSCQMVAEGQRQDEIVAIHKSAFFALPDDTTVVGMQYVSTGATRSYLRSIKGLLLNIPNDLFNGFTRTYQTGRATIVSDGRIGERSIMDLKSSWVSVDDCLSVVGVYGAEGLTLYKPAERQIGLRSSRDVDKSVAGGMLFVDELLFYFSDSTRPVGPDEMIYDIGYILHAGEDHRYTDTFVSTDGYNTLSCSSAAVRCMQVRGKDDRMYIALFNTVETAVTCQLAVVGQSQWADLSSAKKLVAGPGGLTVNLPASGAMLVREE